MEPEHGRTRQFSFLHKLHLGIGRSHDEDERQPPTPPLASPDISIYPSSLSPSDTVGLLSNAAIHADYFDLYASIASHVRRFYSRKFFDEMASQGEVEHALSGLPIPWTRIRILLHDPKDRHGILTLCISWVTLSRCLLLKPGMNNSPGSSFLPPEVVECFQSFSLVRRLGNTDPHNPFQNDLTLLSRWKQISATLSHATYVTNGFSYFDSRNANIELALRDLDPLLRVYAMKNAKKSDSRLSSLREILQKGARLAFTLFGQPSFWKFDWTYPVLSSVQPDDGDENQPNPDCKRSGEMVQPKETTSSLTSSLSDAITTKDIVVWPALLRVMDSEGAWVSKDRVLASKITLETFASYEQMARMLA